MKSKWWAGLCSLVLIGGFIILALAPPPFISTLLQRLDYLSYDLQINALPKPKLNTDFPIAIVDVDERALQQEGRWPWSREKLARLVQAIYDQGATVVAFDFLFPEPQPNAVQILLADPTARRQMSVTTIQQLQQLQPYFANDSRLAASMAQPPPRIVLGMFLFGNATIASGVLPAPMFDLTAMHKTDLAVPAMQGYIGNLPILQQAAQYAGAVSIIPDADGIIRNYSLIQRYRNQLYPSLALAAVNLYLLSPKISLQTSQLGLQQIVDAIYMGQQKIITDAQGRVLIPYRGLAHTFPYYSAADVLHHRLSGKPLQNALVFVGTSAIGLGDQRSTPLQSVYPGVEVHATVAQALLENHFPATPVWALGAEVSWLVFIGLLLIFLFMRFGALAILSITVAFILIIIGGSLWLWQSSDYVLPIILPLIEVVVLAIFHSTWGFLIESRQRSRLKQAFAQYVPAARVAEIAQHPEAISTFEGERKEMSVLFMDIRQFTTIAENLSSSALKKLLNFFFTEMTQVIFSHNGTIDKYVGDMIMAFWGAPLLDDQHASHAVAAALAMQKATELLQPKLAAMDLPAVHIGIGINTGLMDVGDMGSQFRRAYTVLGDTVNLASRLESLTKYYGVGIIVGEATAANLTDFVFQPLDRVKVKGKQNAITIYQPLGLREQLSAETMAELEFHSKAYAAYLLKDWLTATEGFTALAQQFPTKHLYNLMIERIVFWQANPPVDEWDGVWVHLEK